MTEKKFIDTWETSDFEILTDKGFVDVVALHKTVPYEVHVIKTDNGKTLRCADNHIVFDANHMEVFVKDLRINDKIQTEGGLATITEHKILWGEEENMYDFELAENSDHRYYTNGILSHNTMLVKTIAKLLDVPYTICDSTVFTQAGYVGEDVESILSRLYQASGCDIEKTQRGIVLLDEVDKIARKGDNPSITKDVSGEGVQQALLKLLEGSVVRISPQGGRKHPEKEMIEIDTKNILFICSGAFVGIEKNISKRLNMKAVGFAKGDKKQVDKNKLLRYITADDIRSYGLIPELVGRLPVITHTDTLDKDALRRILVEPNNAIIKQYVKMFEMDGVKLTFDDQTLDYIVEKAVEMKLGARGLRNIVEEIMTQYMYDIPSSRKKKLLVTKEYAEQVFKEKFELPSMDIESA